MMCFSKSNAAILVTLFAMTGVGSAHAQHRVLTVRPALQHALVPNQQPPIMRDIDIREAERAISRQSDSVGVEYFRAADHPAKALGHVAEQMSRLPQSGVVLVAKPGFDAQKLLWDLQSHRINSRVFADRISWLGYAGQDGTFVVPEVERGVSMSGVVVATNFRPAPFMMHVRRGDGETIEIAPVYLNR